MKLTESHISNGVGFMFTWVELVMSWRRECAAPEYSPPDTLAFGYGKR